jgi:hypothetical protein
VNLVRAALVKDIAPAEVRSAAGTYNHWDDLRKDQFASSRVPQLLGEVALPYPAGGVRDSNAGGVPVHYMPGAYVRSAGKFYVCTQEHNAGTGISPNNTQYWAELPAIYNADEDTAAAMTWPPVWGAVSRLFNDTKFEDITGALPDFTDRSVMWPASRTINGKVHPAFRFYHPTAGPGGVGGLITDETAVIAGDADGDGIADGLLARINVGRLNGVDYFYTV